MAQQNHKIKLIEQKFLNTINAIFQKRRHLRTYTYLMFYFNSSKA